MGTEPRDFRTAIDGLCIARLACMRRTLYSQGQNTLIFPYIKIDPLRSIRNEFANGSPTHCHFYAVWTSRHESSMIPKALKFATLQKKMAPIPPHT